MTDGGVSFQSYLRVTIETDSPSLLKETVAVLRATSATFDVCLGVAWPPGDPDCPVRREGNHRPRDWIGPGIGGSVSSNFRPRDPSPHT